MTATRVVGIVLLVLGVLALVYGGFSYTTETHDAELGPLELSVREQEQVNVPVWLGIGAVVVGAVVFAVGLRKR